MLPLRMIQDESLCLSIHRRHFQLLPKHRNVDIETGAAVKARQMFLSQHSSQGSLWDSFLHRGLMDGQKLILNSITPYTIRREQGQQFLQEFPRFFCVFASERGQNGRDFQSEKDVPSAFFRLWAALFAEPKIGRKKFV